MTKNIVFMVDYWYPNMSANAICIKQIIRELLKIDSSLNITVLTLNGEEACKEYGDGYQHINILIKRLKVRRKMEEIISESIGLNKVFYDFCLKGYKIIYIIKFIFQKYSINYDFIEGYNKSLEKIDNIDLLIPVCFPFESVISALMLKEKNNNIKIVPILYDLFSMSNTLHWFNFNKKIKMKRNIQLEREMLNKSCQILYISNWEEHLKENLSEYLEKCQLVGIPLLVEHKNLKIKQNSDKNIIKILFSGTVNKKDRSPDFACYLIDRILKNHKNFVFTFNVIGKDIKKIKLLQSKYPYNIVFEQNVSLNKADIEKRNCDIFLSIGNNNAIQIPSKIFDYMAYGKPIIHLAKKENDVVKDILSKYPLSITFDENINNIDNIEKQLLLFLFQQYDKRESFKNVKQMYYNNTPESLARSILSIL